MRSHSDGACVPSLKSSDAGAVSPSSFAAYTAGLFFAEDSVADVSSHAPGSFSWAELATTNQASAVAFYQALFDWGVDESPVGPGETYSMFQLRGRPVAAAYTMRPEERQSGAPPHWNMYVTVSSADDSAKRAEALGGTIIAPPFDVMDVGRMAVLRDPSGAFFQNLGTEEARRRDGGQRARRALLDGVVVARHESRESVLHGALRLDGEERLGGRADGYTEFSIDGRPSIGMMPMSDHIPAEVPSYWMPYFQVADCDASFAKARALGAAHIMGPQDIPTTGRFAVLTDRQGAIFALFTFARS